jgi:pimeloyl-ACP methyl ester carboxylesterase
VSICQVTGGSDSFEVYDTAVLEALTEFIIGMGEKYVPEDDSQLNGTAESNARSTPRDLIVIGHDWGCVLGMRLAAEAHLISTFASTRPFRSLL